MTYTEEVQMVAELHERVMALVERAGSPCDIETYHWETEDLHLSVSERQVLVLVDATEVYLWERASFSMSQRQHTRKIRYNTNGLKPLVERLRTLMVLDDLADV